VTGSSAGRRRTLRAGVLGAVLALGAGVLAACGGTPTAGKPTLNVLMVDNPQMADLQRLTADNFTRQTGIEVHYTVLPENQLRDRTQQAFSGLPGAADQVDVATLSNYEVPFLAGAGRLAPLDQRARDDTGFDQADILPAWTTSLSGPDGHLYAEPFYGESSFLMYRKDVLAQKGVTMPAHPTWDQVARIAAQVDGARPGMKGICLRGQPGWGEVVSPLTTVWNTYGGGWFDQSWQPMLTSPATEQATRLYVDLLRAHGEPDAANAGFTQCLDSMLHSRSALWYDATSAAGYLEGKDSPVAGDIGYAPAPVEHTASSGWLYTWAWAVPKDDRNADAAWKFISWASGKDYEKLVGGELGWSKAPAGKRASTYLNANYLYAANAFAEPTRQAIESADPRNPGTQPRPTLGVQFVGVPEFAALGDQVSKGISAAIAGQGDVGQALRQGQQLAAQVGTRYRR
jgi:sorbitol/mannitol transport system substrate-binding protein